MGKPGYAQARTMGDTLTESDSHWDEAQNRERRGLERSLRDFSCSTARGFGTASRPGHQTDWTRSSKAGHMAARTKTTSMPQGEEEQNLTMTTVLGEGEGNKREKTSLSGVPLK